MSYVEAEGLRNNANPTGMKGRRVEGVNGVSFEVNDPLTVFEKVKGTPKYFQKAKYDLISKFENIGPFQVGNVSIETHLMTLFSSSSHSPAGT